MNSKKKIIFRCNSLLIKKFGNPKRQKPLPKPLDTLIATILSQNTNDNNSYQAYKKLKEKFPEWKEICNVSQSSVKKIIRVAGLAEQKSIAIKKIVCDLKKRNDFKLDYLVKLSVADAIQQLTSFKGVGVKTASCVLLFSLDKNVCPVDTHVHRTVNRIGIVNEKAPDKTFYQLNKNLPKGVAHSFHTNLIRLGREICKPKKPHCSVCPLLKLCNYQIKFFSDKKESSEKSFMLLDNV